MRVPKPGPREVGRAKVGSFEMRLGKISTFEVRPAEVGFFEMRALEEGKMRARKPGPFKARRAGGRLLRDALPGAKVRLLRWRTNSTRSLIQAVFAVHRPGVPHGLCLHKWPGSAAVFGAIALQA